MKERDEAKCRLTNKVEEVRDEINRALLLMERINKDLDALSHKLDVLSAECDRVIRERKQDE